MGGQIRRTPTRFCRWRGVTAKPRARDSLQLDDESLQLDFGSEDRSSTSTNAPRQRLLSYVPHSGWGNQLRALTNALFLASSLNRTLVVPRALKHSDMAGYGCSSSGNWQFEAGAHLERHDSYAKLAT